MSALGGVTADSHELTLGEILAQALAFQSPDPLSCDAAASGHFAIFAAALLGIDHATALDAVYRVADELIPLLHTRHGWLALAALLPVDAGPVTQFSLPTLH